MKYVYYVVWFTTQKTGSYQIRRDHEIRDCTDIVEIAKEIQAEQELPSMPIITNFILLRVEYK